MPVVDWDKRAVFAKEYAACKNGRQAAIAAGVPSASAHAMAYKWLKNTDILAMIREELDARLRELGPVAIHVIEEIMLDPKTPPQTRLTAARDVLDRLGWVPPKRSDALPIIEQKPVKEMSMAELNELIQKALP